MKVDFKFTDNKLDTLWQLKAQKLDEEGGAVAPPSSSGPNAKAAAANSAKGPGCHMLI